MRVVSTGGNRGVPPGRWERPPGRTLTPVPSRDAGRNAGRDAGRNAGRNAGKRGGKDDCSFCRIVAADPGNDPAGPAGKATDADEAEVVYRDELGVAFLDHHPLFLGHTLLVPRRHVVTFADLPAESLAGFFGAGQRLQRAVERATGADGSLVLMNNVVSQSVPHLHLHVIPRRFKDGLRFWLGPRHRYGGDAPTMAEMGEAIRAALAS
jgi:histidine triad (HIT) family protein